MSNAPFETSFHSSVLAAVTETLDRSLPLLVYLCRLDPQSRDFYARYFSPSGILNASDHAFINAAYVKLRLVHGSAEFGYFEALFPNLSVPSIYIVNQGQLADIISGLLSQSEFMARLRAAAPSSPLTSTTPHSTNEPPSTAHSSSAAEAPLSDEVPPTDEVLSTQQPPTSHPHATHSTTLPTNPNLSTEASEQPQHRSPSNTNDRPIKTDREEAVQQHQRQVREMKRRQAEEKQRLRLLLELDRKEIALREKANRDTLAGTGAAAHSLLETLLTAAPASSSCLLSIKFFDGTSIRHGFSSLQTLVDVRGWLDTESHVEIIPSTELLPSFASSSCLQPISYVFHLPEIPRITYSAQDESRSLQDLGLCPRAALILKPIYDEQGSTDTFPQAASRRAAIFAGVGRALSAIGAALFSFFDYGVMPDQAVEFTDSDEEDEHASDLHPQNSPSLNPFAEGSHIRAPLLARTPSLLLIEPHRALAPNPSGIESRPATPNFSRSSRLNRVQGYDDVAKDRKDDDATESYNGNTVNLDKKKDDEDR